MKIQNSEQNIESKNPDLTVQLEVQVDESIVSSSQYSIQKESLSKGVPLSQSRNKKLFLAKVGLIGLIYFSAAVIASIYTIANHQSALSLTRVFRLVDTFWMFLIASFLIKICIYVFHANLHVGMYVLFSLDLINTFFFSLGLYFFLDTYQRQYFITRSHYVVILSFVLFCNFIMFIISTLFKSRRKIYNPWLGIVLMSVFQLISFKIISHTWTRITISGIEYFNMFWPLVLFNIFWCLNSYLIINYRQDEFRDQEQIYCFYGYFFDLFFKFWKFLFANVKLRPKKKIRKVKQIKPSQNKGSQLNL